MTPPKGIKDDIQLQERDYRLMLLVWLLGYASTPQIAIDLFPSVDRTTQRLRRLSLGGYLHSSTMGSRDPRLWQLTALGKRIVAERYPAHVERGRLPRAIPNQGAKHHLLLSDLRLYLSALRRTDPALRAFTWSNAGGQHHQDLQLATWRLNPDAVVKMEHPGGQQARFIGCEADRGTESMKVIRRKLRVYKQLIDEEHILDGLWWIVGHVSNGNETTRIGALTRQAHKAGIGHATRIFSRGHVLARPVLSPARLLGSALSDRQKSPIRLTH